MCGAQLRSSDGRIARTAGAVLMGLTLAACDSPQPEYGVPDTEGQTTEVETTGGETSTTAATDGTDATTEATTDGTTGGSDSGSESSTTDMGTTVGPEPEYGVPATDTDTTTGEPEPEPDYGIPAIPDK